MGTLFDALLRQLQSQFGALGLRIEAGPPRQAVFPAVHREVGDLRIYDHGDELTVDYGHLTHWHYPFGDEQTEAGAVLASLMSDLEEWFSDRLVIWRKPTGGAAICRSGEAPAFPDPGYRKFVWSGPR